MKLAGKKVAITGGIAEGKSLVMRYISEQGYTVASADQVVADLWERPDVLSEIQYELDMPQYVSKADVLHKILVDSEARRSLNGIFHARVLEELLMGEGEFLEIPLLVETCTHTLFDEVWVVACGGEIQRQRMRERGLNDDDIELILATQLSSRVKQAFSTAVIRTNDTLDSVHSQVLHLLEQICLE